MWYSMGLAGIRRNGYREWAKACELTFGDLGEALGVAQRRLQVWQNGEELSGEAMHSVFHFAGRMSGGLEILTGEGRQASSLSE